MSTDAKILAALHAAGDGSVSGAELSRQLGLTRAAIWARIEELRRLGYDIEASPHCGYRLLNTPDLLHAEDLRARLGDPRVIGRQIQVFAQTTSTNDAVDRLAGDDAPEGIVVFAEAQSRGRGRLGRRWVSPARKGLWFSVLLRPPLRPWETTQLTVAAATALCRAIRQQTRVSPEIKWPNDLQVRGRKLAGILTELHAELDRVKYVVLGIGVDVNVNATDFPADLRATATSLKIETGRAIARPELATAMLRELDHDYARVCEGRFAEVADEWAAQCSTLGREVSITVGGRLLAGRAEALDETGALLVRTEHGRLEHVLSGDLVEVR